MVTATRKTVLITGCSEGGLGAALALAFQRQGFYVFATVRNPSKAVAAWPKDETQDHGTIEVLPLDVTSPGSIQHCVDLVRSRTGGKGQLDILVNNAGMAQMGPLLDISIPQNKKVFDVNVWGMLAVTQAFSDLIVRSQGAILNICSIAGAARVAWQETLRIEMEPLGVRVVTAMVGEIETNIYQNTEPPVLPAGSYYRTVESYILDQAAGKLQKQNELVQITANNLVRDVLGGLSGQTWRGGVAGTAKLATWLLPGKLFEWIMHSNRGIYKVPRPEL